MWSPKKPQKSHKKPQKSHKKPQKSHKKATKKLKVKRFLKCIPWVLIIYSVRLRYFLMQQSWNRFDADLLWFKNFPSNCKKMSNIFRRGIQFQESSWKFLEFDNSDFPLKSSHRWLTSSMWVKKPGVFLLTIFL